MNEYVEFNPTVVDTKALPGEDDDYALCLFREQQKRTVVLPGGLVRIWTIAEQVQYAIHATHIAGDEGHPGAIY